MMGGCLSVAAQQAAHRVPCRPASSLMQSSSAVALGANSYSLHVATSQDKVCS